VWAGAGVLPQGRYLNTGIAQRQRVLEGQHPLRKQMAGAMINFAPSRASFRAAQAVGGGRRAPSSVRFGRVAARCAAIPLHIEYCEK